MARHRIGLRVSQRFASLVGWANDQARVARDIEELVRAIMLMFAGNPANPHTVTLGGETFNFNTGPIFENFLDERAGPSGPKWPRWSPAYAKRRAETAGTVKSGKRAGKARTTKILTLSGDLWREATRARSISVKFSGGKVTAAIEMDTDEVPYARIHNEGGTIHRPAIQPRNAKILAWTWWMKGGHLVKGPFFATRVGPATIRIPQREYLTIGASIPPRYRSVLDRMIAAWFHGIVNNKTGVPAEYGYEVTSA